MFNLCYKYKHSFCYNKKSTCQFSHKNILPSCGSFCNALRDLFTGHETLEDVCENVAALELRHQNNKSAIFVLKLPIYYYLAEKLEPMAKKQYEIAVQQLLERDSVLSVADFKEICPDLPEQTVFSRIRALQQSGKLCSVGKGKYLSVPKPPYRPVISALMRTVHQQIIEGCERVNFCLCQHNANLYVYSGKAGLAAIYAHLQESGHKVLYAKDLIHIPVPVQGYIILDILVSESPVLVEDGVQVPSLEMAIVDSLCGRSPLSALELQKRLEVYPLNENRMRRYAARRGLTQELEQLLLSVDRNRMAMMNHIQQYLARIPVCKAWMFGSFARGEETEQSDIDLLVEYDPSVRLSLLDVVRYQLDLEKLIQRKVDLIEDGYLKPFAVASANRDKYLIYAR